MGLSMICEGKGPTFTTTIIIIIIIIIIIDVAIQADRNVVQKKSGKEVKIQSDH